MRHMMLDIETLGKKPGCVVLCAAYSFFDPLNKSEPIETTQVTFDIWSQLMMAFTIEKDTLQWWQGQNTNAIQSIGRANRTVEEGLGLIADTYTVLSCVNVWAKSPDFDCSIMEALFDAYQVKCPWTYKHKRDVRTAEEIGKMYNRTVTMTGTAHNAMHDVVHQIEIVRTAING